MNLWKDPTLRQKLYTIFDLQSSQDQIPNQVCLKPENSITQFNQPINQSPNLPQSKSISPTINSRINHQITFKIRVRRRNYKIEKSNHERKERHFLMSFQNSQFLNKSSNLYTASTNQTFQKKLSQLQHNQPQSKPFIHSNLLHSMIRISKMNANSRLKKSKVNWLITLWLKAFPALK